MEWPRYPTTLFCSYVAWLGLVHLGFPLSGEKRLVREEVRQQEAFARREPWIFAAGIASMGPCHSFRRQSSKEVLR